MTPAVLCKHRLVADDLLYILTTEECMAATAMSSFLSDACASDKHKKNWGNVHNSDFALPRINKKGQI